MASRHYFTLHWKDNVADTLEFVIITYTLEIGALNCNTTI